MQPPDSEDEDVLRAIYYALKDPKKTETTNAELKSYGLTETPLKPRAEGRNLPRRLRALPIAAFRSATLSVSITETIPRNLWTRQS